jgi:hypothetical protein
MTVRVTSSNATKRDLVLQAHLSLEMVNQDNAGASGHEIGVIQHRQTADAKAPISTGTFPAFSVGQQIIVPLQFDKVTFVLSISIPPLFLS